MNKEIFEVFDGKTVLVTGGAGAIGSCLSKTLAYFKTKKIIILDDLSSSYEWNIPIHQKIEFIKGSILDQEKLDLAFSEKPEIVKSEKGMGLGKRITVSKKEGLT